MKLWKGNRLDGEHEIPNKEIAERFMQSNEYLNTQINYGIANMAVALANFITQELNSVWEWDKKKGSIDGSQDMLEILDLIDEMEKER